MPMNNYHRSADEYENVAFVSGVNPVADIIIDPLV